MEKECVKCKLRELTKGKKSSFADDTLALEFLKDKGLITNPHKVFIIQGKFGAVSLNDLLVEFKQKQK